MESHCEQNAILKDHEGKTATLFYIRDMKKLYTNTLQDPSALQPKKLEF
jgi:hypothetical protein